MNLSYAIKSMRAQVIRLPYSESTLEVQKPSTQFKRPAHWQLCLVSSLTYDYHQSQAKFVPTVRATVLLNQMKSYNFRLNQKIAWCVNQM